MFELVPNSVRPRDWWQWAIVIVAAELLWFCLMYPLIPRTVGAAVVEALLPLPLLGYVYLVVRCLFWISKQSWSVWMRRFLSTAVAVILGAAGVAMIAVTVVQTPAEFGYQSIHGL
jgi:hypothetical protein